MKNEDEFILQQIIRNVGCIPIYWENFAANLGLNHITRICNSTNDYNTTNHQMSNALQNLDSPYTTNRQPCTDMVALVTAKDETCNEKDCPFFPSFYRKDNTSGVLHLQFNYQQNLYREIINTQAHTGESLLGQVGGFVGMYNMSW